MCFLKKRNKLEEEEEEEQRFGRREAGRRHTFTKCPHPPQQSYLSSKLQDVRTRLVEVNPWLSCSYPQSHKAWCTGDRAQRRGILGVYGIRREKFFSRINSHVIDVLKVDRRGDQAGVMMRGWMREAWLTK